LPDLTLPPTARRRTVAVTAVTVGALAMTMIVFADNNHWAGAFALAALLGIALYVLGTPAFRAQVRGPGRVQFNTMLGNHQVDLRNGFTVKRGWLGGRIVKVGRKRYRVNYALGDAAALEAWLAAAAA
jgi:hypothetical protein